MTVATAVQYAVFLVIVTLLVKPVGSYLDRVFNGEPTWFDPVLRPLERGIYRIARVHPEAEMDWKQYASAFVALGFCGALLLYTVLRLQPIFHGFDPAYRPGPVAPDLAMISSGACPASVRTFSETSGWT